MNKFIRTHAEWVLIAAGVLLAACIVWFMVWGVTTMAGFLGTSLSNSAGAGGAQGFDIEKASQLDFKGLAE